MRTTDLTYPTRLFLVLLAAIALLAGPSPAQPASEEPGELPGAQPEIDPAMDWGDQPARPARANRPQPTATQNEDDPTVSFGVFSEPVQLTTLIDFVGDILRLNIVVKGSPTGEIVFNAPVSVPESRLLDLLDAMLEQYGFTITSEPASGFYIVQPITDVRPSVGGDRSSVRIIPTPNIKPSQLVTPLTAVLGAGGGGTNSVQPVDELGVIIVSAPSRDIARVEAMVEELMRIDAMQQFIRLELRHIAAPAALERAVGLVAGSGTAAMASNPQLSGRNIRELQNNPQANLPTGGTFSNLADRMTIDPQGNALIFRGTETEIARVRSVLAQIDVPNTLEPKNYFAGSSATQIANMAKNRGLGEVIEVTDPSASAFGDLNIQLQRGLQQGLGQTGTNTPQGGPVMVVDAARGSIIYYGTPEQQQQLDNLMKELRTEDERIVIREYVLNHSDAETVADLITGLITGERQTGDAPLLPTSRGVNRFDNTLQQNRPTLFNDPNAGSGDDVSAAFDPDIVTVLADPENNQVIVQAPAKQQGEIAKLIDRLDRRRAQVYIQAMIVSITDNEDFTLAFETQLKAGQFGVNTNFGLSSFGTGAGFTDAKNVSTSLGGLTAAVIQSEYVPIIINATQTNTDVRILSSPQLLVNDNEEAEIVSIEEQPFSTTNVGQTTDTTTFGGFAEAGTTLRVTPSISDGGFLRLEYYVELSNFTAASGIDGNPPPRNTRRVEGKATIPSDATIVVGGLTVDDIRDTIMKVPFLGDIPLVGELFKKTNKVNNKAKLYVFLTPRIMTDPNFNDLKLLTEGPQSTMQLDPDAPPLEPAPIRSTVPASRSGAPELEPAPLD